MDRNRMLFCPDLATGLTTQVISNELAEKVFGDKSFAELLKARYDQMGHWFRDAHYNDSHWDLDAPFSDCKNKADRDKKDARLVVPRSRLVSAPQNVTRLFDYDNFGHDMPIWVSYNQDPNAKRVMIVSQDPLRGSETSYDEKGRLYLSTPFGIHSRDFEKYGMDSRVQDMMNMFLEADICVCLTDYMKFYAKNRDEKKRAKSFVLKKIKDYKGLFSRALSREIGMVTPDLMIVLGCELREKNITDTSLVNTHPASDGFDVQHVKFEVKDSNGRPIVKDQAVITAYHPSGACGRATPIIRKLVQRKVGGDVEHPIKKYYELIAAEACNYLSGHR